MQINRLFEIVYILLEKEKVTARELAERFEVSVRTVYRDIDALSCAGIPVYMSKGKGGGISLLPGFTLNKAIITEGEKAEILSALKAVDAVKPEGETAALRKLGSLFGESGYDWIEVDFGTWSDNHSEEVLFHNIKKAVIEKRVICFSYANAKGQTSEREVEPLKLCFKGEAWYLYAWCRKNGEERFFKLKRIRKLRLTEEVFQRTCRETVLKKDPENYWTDSVQLKLKIAKEAAFRVYEEFEDYKELEDGSFLAEMSFPKGEWLFYYLLGFGQAVEVLEPAEVREQLKGELEKMLEKYLD